MSKPKKSRAGEVEGLTDIDSDVDEAWAEEVRKLMKNKKRMRVNIKIKPESNPPKRSKDE
jgi:hypothetical protein